MDHITGKKDRECDLKIDWISKYIFYIITCRNKTGVHK